VNLPNAIEHLRRMHAHDALFADADPDYARNAQALAVCLEVLAEQAHDGGAILREVNPKAYAPKETT
jgi:hypothetical protein